MTKDEQLKYLDDLYAQVERGEVAVTSSSVGVDFSKDMKTVNLQVGKVTKPKYTINYNYSYPVDTAYNSAGYIYSSKFNTTTSPFNTVTGIS
jgi:hypothetical protein